MSHPRTLRIFDCKPERLRLQSDAPSTVAILFYSLLLSEGLSQSLHAS